MTDKEIKSLFDKLNPDDIQKQKAWKSIQEKAAVIKPPKKSYKKVLLIAAMISVTAVISAFGINALSGGSLFNNIGKVIIGNNKPVPQAKAAIYTAETSTEASSSMSLIKRSVVKENKKIKTIKTNEENTNVPDNDIITTEPHEQEVKTIHLIGKATYPTSPENKLIQPTNSKNQVETREPNEVIKGNFLYLPLSENTANIVEYIGKESKIIIPSEIDGYKIVGIDEYAFTCNKYINEVIIPEGVETIAEGAFKACNNLTSVSMPESLVSINGRAFMSTSLKSVDIPENVRTVGTCAFQSCKKLTTAKFGKNIKLIGYNAFSDNLDTIIGYTNTAAYNYAKNSNVNFRSLGNIYETEETTSTTTEPASQEPDPETEKLCRTLNNYITSIGAQNYVSEFNAENISNIKFYKIDSEIKAFHIKSANESKCSEIIGSYKFNSDTLLSEKYNKTGYCILYNNEVYSIKEAVEFDIISSAYVASIFNAEPQRQVLENCLFFDTNGVDFGKQVCCHIYERKGDSFFIWQGKHELCNKFTNEIYYYDLDKLNRSESMPGKLNSNKSYLIMFSGSNGNVTVECTFGKECIGDTLRLTKEIVENPIDSEKKQYEAKWVKSNSSYGPHFQFTSKGKSYGTYLCPDDKPVELIGDWLSNYYLAWWIEPTYTLLDTYKLFSINTTDKVEEIYDYTVQQLSENYRELYSDRIKQMLYKAFYAVNPAVKATEAIELSTKNNNYDVKINNPIKIAAKKVSIKAKKLKEKSLTVKPLTIKNIVTKVKIVKVKNGTSSKIFKRIKVNKSTGAVTFTKGKYNKKTYSVKLKITASENATYRTKTITKLVKIKIK